MKRTITLTTMALAATFAAHAPAAAQDWYGQVFGGYSFADDLDQSGLIGGAPNSVRTDLDDGYHLGFSVGRSIPGLDTGPVRLRGEIELSYGENDVDGVNFSGNGPGAEANPNGDISTTYLFGNVLADFQTGGPVTPYVGAGLGVGFVDQSIGYGNGVTISGSDEAFAAQLIAGASYQVNDRTALFADARYIRSFDVEGIRTAGGNSAQVSDDLNTVTLNVGLRFNF